MQHKYSIYDWQTFKKNEPAEVLAASVAAALRAEAMYENERLIGAFTKPDLLIISLNDMHYSLGAKHYYASIDLPRFNWAFESNPLRSLMSGDYCTPPSCVKITAPLSAKEIRSDPNRYKCYKAGDPYHGFLTVREAFLAAQKWLQITTVGFKIALDDHDYDLGDLANVFPLRSELYVQNFSMEDDEE
ncbi:MAG: hypothetical protein K9N47_21170 [Prosthecobacter sp.]|nr:hypothetical protein [Prosthecobacter sp.]